MCALPIKDGGDFGALIEALATDVMNAHFHLDLLKAIWEAQDLYEREFAQSPWFWHLTTGALLETGLIKLARAYDTNRKGLHLSNWLRTIESNLHIFAEEDFRERLKGSEFVESLAAEPRVPDLDELKEDLELVSKDDPHVKKLLRVRHNALAHRSGKMVLAGRNPFKEQGFSVDVIHLLSDRAVDIVNRYTQLFRATSYSKQPVGENDFVGTLALAKKGIDCLEREEDQDLESPDLGSHDSEG